jgi:hypothetical protein
VERLRDVAALGSNVGVTHILKSVGAGKSGSIRAIAVDVYSVIGTAAGIVRRSAG